MEPRILLVGESSEISKSIRAKALKSGYSIHTGYNNRTTENENDPTKTYVDSTNPKSIENLILRAKTTLGDIDHLIYTSGISEKRWTTEEQSWEELNKIIQINLTGAIYAATQFSKRIDSKNEKNKSIVLISSESGEYGGKGISTYAATKAGLNTFARGYARQLKSKNCGINVVSPGKIGKNEKNKSSLMEDQGTGNDVAEAVLWLISDQSSYCSGAKISINGGN